MITIKIMSKTKNLMDHVRTKPSWEVCDSNQNALVLETQRQYSHGKQGLF